MIEPYRQPAEEIDRQVSPRCLRIFADLLPGLVLAKASLDAELGPSHRHPGQAKAATNCGLLVAPNR